MAIPRKKFPTNASCFLPSQVKSGGTCCATWLEAHVQSFLDVRCLRNLAWLSTMLLERSSGRADLGRKLILEPKMSTSFTCVRTWMSCITKNGTNQKFYFPMIQKSMLTSPRTLGIGGLWTVKRLFIWRMARRRHGIQRLAMHLQMSLKGG